MVQYIHKNFIFSDCSTPFIVSVHTNAAGAEAIGATAQRGTNLFA